MRIIAFTNKKLDWKPPYGELIERPLGAVEFYDGDLDQDWVRQKTKEISQEMGNIADIILFFVEDYGRDLRIFGRAYGGYINDYKVGVVRAGRYQTAEHELLHMFNDLVFTYLGYELSDVFQVSDFDEDVVHGRHPSYREYDYDKVFTKCKPYIINAVSKRKKDYIFWLEKLITAYRKFLILQTNKTVMEHDEKPSDLLPLVKRKADEFIELASQKGYTLRVTSGFRSIEEQDQIYAQGRTSPGNIVTNAKGGESLHNYGVAIDIVDRYRGYNVDWNELGELGESLGFEWGGRWAVFVDKPHFEMKKGYELSDFQQGKVNYEVYL